MIDEHLTYLLDSKRTAAFRNAIARRLTRGSTVVDLGCGTGILGLLCLQAGAGKVYAIDSSPMISVAREVFSRAGFKEKVTLFHAHSASVELPGRADVVISDQIGLFGFDAGIVQYYADAARRFLVPGGSLIPARLRMWIGGVESAETYASVERWANAPAGLSWLRVYAANTRRAARLPDEAIVTSRAHLGDLLLDQPNQGLITWNAELRVARSGVLHGIGGWFQAELAPDVWMTNAPGEPTAIDRPQAFLPIDTPTEVEEGTRLGVTVIAKPADGLIAWTVRMPSGKCYKQSTWNGAPLAPKDVARISPQRIARLTSEGSARATVLAYCDGQRTIREVEDLVLIQHPGLLPSKEEISRFVSHVLANDTE